MVHRIATAGIALVMLLAISVAAAGTASAARLTLIEEGTAGTPLAPGDFLEARGEQAEVYLSPAGGHEGVGYLGCYKAGRVIEGYVVTNSKRHDEIELSGRELEAYCNYDTSNTGYRVSGPLILRANGKATAGSVHLSIYFNFLFYHGQRWEAVLCEYSGRKMTGTDTATTTREYLEIELKGKLRREGNSFKTKSCPITGEISLSVSEVVYWNENGEAIAVEEQT
jgi:hypothetical protein